MTDLVVLPFHQKKDALLEDLTPSSLFSPSLFPLPPTPVYFSFGRSARRPLPFRGRCLRFSSLDRAIRTRHFFFSGRWYHSRLDRAKHTSSRVSFFFFFLSTTTTTTTNNNNHHHPAASPGPIVSPPLAAGQHRVHLLSYSSDSTIFPSERARGCAHECVPSGDLRGIRSTRGFLLIEFNRDSPLRDKIGDSL